MLKNLSLRDRFKLLLAPVIILTTILILFISYSEYQNSNRLTILEKDIKITENLRKLVSLISKEREISLKYVLASERIAKRMKRDLRKQRSINNTRFKSLNKKLTNFSAETSQEKIFFTKVIASSKKMQTQILDIRQKVDSNSCDSEFLINSYTSIISNIIHLIANSSLEIENSTISKNIVIYSIFLKYIDILHQRDIFIEKIISEKKITLVNRLEISQIDAQKNVIIDIASSLVTRELLLHFQRVNMSKDIIKLDVINKNMMSGNYEIISNINHRDLIEDTNKYYQKLQELEDYISRNILQELNYSIDKNIQRTAYLKISSVLSILLILYITYLVYNNLREMLFFGTAKIRGSILRVMANIDVGFESKQNNEILSLISLVRKFTRIIRITLFKIRDSFREILALSNHLAESSGIIVNHVQKQSKYLENINLKLEVFLDNLNNSTISFQNLKEIIQDSSLKLNNLNLDVVFISHEVASILHLNKELMSNKIILKDNLSQKILSLETESHSAEKKQEIIDFMKETIEIVDNEIKIIETKVVKLSHLSKTTVTIKKDAEINNANLSDILGVITILGFETKDITSDINESVEENTKLIKISKLMVERSKYLSSDTNILNNNIIELDKEFNKFRF